jgi:thiol-disulfide isomerase/thioredoxin
MISLPTITLLAVLSNPGDVVLLDFYADWCGPCRSMDPTIRKLTADGYPVRKVNIDHQQQLAQQYGVDRVPTYVLVAGGREITRVVGPTSYDGLARMFSAAKTRNAQVASSPPRAAPTQAQLAPVAHRSGGDAQARAMHATVRLRVEDQKGNSVGTGTIVDMHGEEALVMTCAHLFRDSRGKGPTMVDLFAPGAKGPVPGKVIDFDLETDVALVAIQPGVKIAPIPVATPGYKPRQGDSVFSIGCDRGADPSIRESRISNLNKYIGAANIEVAGAPVIGRSGGGLFSADGRLIGICNLADPKDDEGIYAATSLLHANLDRNNLAWIYDQPSQQIAGSDAPQPAPVRAEDTSLAATQPPPDMARQMPRSPLGDSVQPLIATGGSSPQLDSLLRQLPADSEVICIVRSRTDPAQSKTFYLNQPSQSLIMMLANESQAGQSGAEPVVLEAARSGDRQAPDWNSVSDRGEVMRGQTR